jgi:glutathione S-transferase
MTLTLYDAVQSPNCQRVHIALHEKGLPFERVRLNLGKKEQKTTDFMRMNPYGRVPVLIDGDLVLYESCIINEYLDTRYTNPPLSQRDPALVAQGRLFIDYALNFLQEYYWPLRAEMRKPEADRNLPTVEHNRLMIIERLDRLEAALGDKPYFFQNFGLTDIGLWPRLSRIEEYGALESPQLPNLKHWLRRMSLRPSVQSVLQDR